VAGGSCQERDALGLASARSRAVSLYICQRVEHLLEPFPVLLWCYQFCKSVLSNAGAFSSTNSIPSKGFCVCCRMVQRGAVRSGRLCRPKGLLEEIPAVILWLLYCTRRLRQCPTLTRFGSGKRN
jgi:hypothetical protein